MKLSAVRHKINLVALCFLYSVTARAEFQLDFMPDDGGALGSHLGTPFLMRGGNSLPEVVTDPETGLTYYHMIMGDPAEGLMQDVYIQRGYGSFQGGPGSAVGGSGNNADPFGVNSASGEANPRKVLIRQIVSDGEIYIDFIKDKFDRKPKVTQMLTLPDLTSLFQVDMSNSSYGDDATPGIVSYTMSLADDYQDEADFNLATDAQNSLVTGGRYTYTNGGGPGGSDGTYNYVQGSFNQPTWEDYFDFSLPNQWSNTTNRPTPP